MLAFMPQSPSLPLDRPTTLPTSTLSVAILPSAPLTCGQSASIIKSASPAKKPKLSLNTATVPTVFGKGSTSLRLETLSAASPTSRNTFKNTYSPQAWSASNSNTLKFSSQCLDEPSAEDQASSSQADDSDCSDLAESVVSSASAVSASTAESSFDDIPYELPTNTRSILSNGPVPRVRYRKPARKMFPSRKAVAFRTPLTEEVRTYKYTLSNFDFETLPSASPSIQAPLAENLSKPKPLSTASAGTPHEASATAGDDDDALCPVTPVAGKRKRDRQWVWTLGSSAAHDE